MLVTIFKNIEKFRNEDWDRWQPIINGLFEKGYEVKSQPEKCDISIVLSGRMENPLCFSGKRVLVFYPPEWIPNPWGARLYGKILGNYYHEYIRLEEKASVSEIVDSVISYIKKAKNGDIRRQISKPGS